MPTPRPIRVASVGENVGDVDDVRQQAGEAEADAEREHRGEQRQQRRPQRAEGDREHDGGGDEADELARPAARLLGGLLDPGCRRARPGGRRRARPRRWRSACRRRSSGTSAIGCSPSMCTLANATVLSLEIWRAAAPCANGLSTRSTCGIFGDRGERLLDPRLGRGIGDVVGGEHHLVGVRRLGVEVVGEQVQRRRGLRARQRERVGVAGAGAGAEAAEDEQRDHPDREDD